MKRLRILTSVMVILILNLGCVLNAGAKALRREEADFVLPAELTEIGAEAFQGCPAVRIYLQEKVISIGEDAFAGCSALREIRIPASVTRIAGSAFDGCGPDITVYGEPGSEAERFAKEKGFHFIPQESGDIVLPIV